MTNVIVTDTAKAKCFRLFSQRSIHKLVEAALDGRARVYDRGDWAEYHIIGTTSDGTEAAVVAIPEDGEVIVKTQMHCHADYRTDDVYSRVDELPLEEAESSENNVEYGANDAAEDA